MVLGWTLLAVAAAPGLGAEEPAPAAEGPPFGLVPIPKDMRIEIHCGISGTGKPAILPRGGYNLDSWTISRTDSDGVAWTCSGYVPDSNSVFHVAQGQETKLPIGEPVFSRLTAVQRGSEVTFSHDWQGQMGERIQIYRNGEQALAPMLRIKNADGSYDRTLTFAYG
jgi:hypothetical protein